MKLIFDIETNGLLRELTTIHSLVIYDLDSNKYYSCTDNFYVPEDDSIETRTVKQGIEMLSKADVIIGHNIVKFDIPAIQKLYPDFTYNKARDTLLMAKLVYPDIGLIDDRLILKNQLPKAMRGRYSLESFGYRLKEYKGDYCHQENAWNNWSSTMQTYCEQDVRVTVKLWNTLIKHEIPEITLDIEHEFATILFNQEMRGVHFDLDKAVDMASQLQAKKLELEQQLKEAFPDEIVEETFIPKVNNKNRGYVKGVPFVKQIVIEFNPSSRDMIAQRLVKKYGWKPKHLSNTGKPILNEEIIDTLKYPEAPLLKEYFLVTKVLGQLLEGKNAWLKLYDKTTEAIHGSVDTIGAVTCRCTHKYPNLAQVPAVGGFMGKECRELFCAIEGYNLVGCDASGLELRCLAHYMKDDEYTHEILNGDIHTKNQIAAGLPTRAEAKRFIYAFIYGGGDALIGSLVGGKSKEGKEIKAKFLSSLPSLDKLIKGVKKKIKTRGSLKGLDKRKLKVREEYKGLNVLLQSAGAIVMKKALCILWNDLKAKGYKLFSWSDYCKGNRDFDIAFVLNVHDEYQAEVKPEITDEYKVMAVEAIRKAGEFFGYRCPLDGEAKVGHSWFDTH